METSGLFNPVVRVKVEPCDDLLTQNNYEPIDEISVTENVKYERFLQENSTQEVQKYDEHQENDDLQIELECKDMKPYLFTVAKIEDHSPNFRPHSDVYKNGSIIKLEIIGTVKKEIFSEEESDLNLGRGLSEKNKKRSVLKGMNYKHSLITQIESVRNANIKPACVHNGIGYVCDVCGKTFAGKSNLKAHIKAIHNGVRHTCDICEKTFTKKYYLQNHIDSVHNGIVYTCDICQKTFSDKSNLRNHIDSSTFNGFARIDLWIEVLKTDQSPIAMEYLKEGNEVHCGKISIK
uniref:C2H2-type domain-containing protein n=1 Tax=Trichogramma kaykai TaxID=54128 RepID=A0ABD2XKX7_9HYME